MTRLAHRNMQSAMMILSETCVIVAYEFMYSPFIELAIIALSVAVHAERIVSQENWNACRYNQK